MKQDLSLQLGQKLIMTPKMQQAVKILQMSSQELHKTIEEEYNENPTLEFTDISAEEPVSTDKVAADDINNLAEFLNNSSNRTSSSFNKESFDFKTIPAPTQNLADMLHEQALLTFTANQQHIADYIIDCIDERGYLIMSLEDIQAAIHVDINILNNILERIQTFEPLGIGARNLSECLRIQACYYGFYHGISAAIIDKYIELIGKNSLKKIAEKENVSIIEVQDAVNKIKQLNPKPGCAYGNEIPQHIIPDVTVQKVDDTYIVLVNQYTVPSLHISDLYRNTHNMDEQTKSYVEKRVNSAIWLINSIEQRRQTLYNVCEQIVQQQKAFFDNGFDSLAPLTMSTIADTLNIHESTVSRAIANKYMETPHGIISIRKFFSANVTSTSTGEELIARQIKTVIKELILGENPVKPLSDQKLCNLLKERDINISRRTVMKYREQLGYQSSANRKQYS